MLTDIIKGTKKNIAKIKLHKEEQIRNELINPILTDLGWTFSSTEEQNINVEVHIENKEADYILKLPEEIGDYIIDTIGQLS